VEAELVTVDGDDVYLWSSGFVESFKKSELSQKDLQYLGTVDVVAISKKNAANSFLLRNNGTGTDVGPFRFAANELVLGDYIISVIDGLHFTLAGKRTGKKYGTYLLINGKDIVIAGTHYDIVTDQNEIRKKLIENQEEAAQKKALEKLNKARGSSTRSLSEVTDTKLGDRIDAWCYAQAFVEDHLKAPATAKFSPFSDERTGCKLFTNGSWHIWGWVDSQNGFSALLRGNWEVYLTVDKQAGKASLSYLRIDEQEWGTRP